MTVTMADPAEESMNHDRAQIFEVSTLYGAATLAAALDAGAFGPRTGTRRILLVSNNAPVPETVVQLSDMHGYRRIVTRFDEVVSWNEVIHPHRPSQWAPSEDESSIWQRLFRHSWGLGDVPVELVVESIQVNPARALATIFAESAVHVYADGLMSYGPTREKLPGPLGNRVQRVLHLDLVPGLRPLLLAETGAEPELVPDDAFRAVLKEIAVEAADDPRLTALAEDPPTAVLLGQYLAALRILSPQEEEELHVTMVRGAIAAGHRSIVFKPHPTAPAGYSKAMEEAAAAEGARLRVLDGPLLAETLYEVCRPRLVVGCFSTAMLTASAYCDVAIARAGTRLVLDRLTPYQNSNRVPLTIVDHLVPDVAVPDGRGGAAGELAALVRAVGFCMQPRMHPGLREETAAWLRDNLGPDTEHYFRRRRLTSLGLPGGGPLSATQRLRGNTTVRRMVRVARRLRARAGR
ncbi:alpha-2,8-polysialyltransferase family protein [Actinacidiphila glaucinigra]|uniref:polysialyltransferase family glycosyltransferase n=1 Tax=Actinacidiphila glaucinigra TaxID=235986 RepID=UPI002DDA8CC2|nr:polysialyltransferase family glycosyltransferase [Actinacidiphila glaucinigra]WSD65488.1 alpha-2,8-polysialyltransferase family protein [Actinacidiphila glaucinigra]